MRRSGPTQAVAARVLFQAVFGGLPTRLARCPARVELLGNHTDYNAGLVVAACIDRHLEIAVGPRKDDVVEVVTGSAAERVQFRLAELERDSRTPWADYVKGVLVELRRLGRVSAGFQVAIDSSIPQGGGLSSSAALLLGTALALGELPHRTATERLELARLCQRAESDFVGLRCGLLDYLTILHGQPGTVLWLDFQSLRVKPVRWPRGQALLLADSGVRHRLTGGGYNAIRAAGDAAAEKLGVPTLRALRPGEMRAAAERVGLTARELSVAMHNALENQRVREAVRALAARRAAADFGRCMFESHASSRDALGNSCPELNRLVALATQAAHVRGVAGARLSGGGFGGMTVHLVAAAQLPTYRSWLARRWRALTGTRLGTLACSIAGGAECFDLKGRIRPFRPGRRTARSAANSL